MSVIEETKTSMALNVGSNCLELLNKAYILWFGALSSFEPKNYKWDAALIHLFGIVLPCLRFQIAYTFTRESINKAKTPRGQGNPRTLLSSMSFFVMHTF